MTNKIHFDSSPWQNTTRLALMIGIDDYRGNELHPLKGCICDLENLAAVLGQESYGFGTVLLRNQEATRNGILEAMSTLLEHAKAGDQVVLYWSGHGSTLKFGTGRHFETLVPFDSSRTGKWSDNRDITDRELFGWVCRISEKGAFLTLIIDGCRAGGIVRDLVARPRGATGESTPGGGLDLDKNAFLPVEFESSKVGRSGWFPLSDRYTLLAACESHENCREVVDPNTSQHRGVFSLELQRALLRSDWRHLRGTWRELFEGVAAAVSQRCPAQHPQLEGRRDAEVFGGAVHRPDFFVKVVAREGKRVQLKGGSAQGIVQDSVWAIYPALTRRPGEPVGISAEPGEKNASGDCLGEVLLDCIGATRSEGTLIGESSPGRVGEGCRAFEVSRPILSQLRVLLDPLAARDAELVRQIQKSSHLSLVPGGETEAADVVVLRLHARNSCGEREPLPQLPAIREQSWALLDPTGVTQLAPLSKVATQGSRQKVLEYLETRSRHHFLTRLEHPRPEVSTAATAKLAVFRLTPEPVRIESGESLPEIELGTSLGFKLQHQHDQPLRLNIIALGAAASIEPIYPVRGRSEIWTSAETLRIGFEDADALYLDLPENYPFPGEPPFSGAEEEILFLITVDTPENMDLLARPELRTGTPKRANPAQLALRAMHGITFRDLPPVDALASQKEWGLLRWRYRLIPRHPDP